MPSSTTPGSSTSVSSRPGMSTLAFTAFYPVRHSLDSRKSVSRGEKISRLHWFAHCYGLSFCPPPCTDLTRSLQPSGTFTSGLPAGRSPFPPPDMTTPVTGLLCWRDFHPQEWQLALLH